MLYRNKYRRLHRSHHLLVNSDTLDWHIRNILIHNARDNRRHLLTNARLIRDGEHRRALRATMSSYCLLSRKRQQMLTLSRRLIILPTTISNRHHSDVRVKKRLQRTLRLAMLYLISLRHADSLLRQLCLYQTARAKRESARIGNKTRTLIRRIHLGMCLSINSKSSIHKSVYQRITHLHLSSKRYHRKTAAASVPS